MLPSIIAIVLVLNIANRFFYSRIHMVNNIEVAKVASYNFMNIAIAIVSTYIVI